MIYVNTDVTKQTHDSSIANYIAMIDSFSSFFIERYCGCSEQRMHRA